MGSVGPRVYDRCVLRRLRIENLVLIREAELELAPGLNAITGETGAGKTILAQALGLLLGAKGDDSFVGAAAEEAYVEAELDLPDELEELGELRPEDEDALVVSRRVFDDGRTRAYAWGRAAAREDEPLLAVWPQIGERLEAVLVEQPLRQLELGLDVGLVGGRAEKAGVALRSEQEPDRLGEDRLAGTGLARNRVQPGRELELGLPDQDEVLDAQPSQH